MGQQVLLCRRTPARPAFTQPAPRPDRRLRQAAAHGHPGRHAEAKGFRSLDHRLGGLHQAARPAAAGLAAYGETRPRRRVHGGRHRHQAVAAPIRRRGTRIWRCHAPGSRGPQCRPVTARGQRRRDCQYGGHAQGPHRGQPELLSTRRRREGRDRAGGDQAGVYLSPVRDPARCPGCRSARHAGRRGNPLHGRHPRRDSQMEAAPETGPGQPAARQVALPAERPAQLAGGPGRHPVLKRQRGPAQGRGAVPSQHPIQLQADLRRAQHPGGRRADGVTTAFPRLRIDGDHDHAADRGYPDRLPPRPH